MYLKYPFNENDPMMIAGAIIEGRKEKPSSEIISKYSPELREIENKLLTMVFIEIEK
jgi:hypothetical protein